MSLLTEKEAVEMWCPMVRYSNHNGDGINRWTNDHDQQLNPLPARCIGSRCMAWRWGEPPRSVTKRRYVYVDYADTATTEERQSTTEGRGYCGAFGQVVP